MYLASALPGPAQALPGPTHQALSRPHQAPPGPTRPYQALRPTRPEEEEDHTGPHAGSHTFLAAPKNTSKTTCFFLEPLEKAKTYILQCKIYVFPEMAKNVQKLYQNLLFRQLTFQKT